MAINFTWGGLAQSSNPPQTFSDALSIASLSGEISISVTLTGTAPNGLQLTPFVKIYGSTDGVTFTLISGQSLFPSAPNGSSTVVFFPPFAVGSYVALKIQFTPGTDNNGYLSAGVIYNRATLAPITWASSTTSANPPQLDSDVISIAGTQYFAAVVETFGFGMYGIGGYANVQASPDGSTWTTVGTVGTGSTNSVPTTASSGVIPTGSYLYARIDRPLQAFNNGYCFNSFWNSATLAALPPVGAPGLAIAPTLPASLGALFQALGNNYGVDVLCLTDLDPNFSLIQNALPQDVWHLISEQPGSIFWSPNQTFSLRSLLSKGIMPAALSAVEATIISVIQADERVAQCQCLITQSGSESLQIQITVFPEQGSVFNLVAAISKVTITLISVGLVNL